LNFRDVEALGRQMLRDAATQLTDARRRKEALDDEVRRRKEGLEHEYEAHRSELEGRLAALRADIDALREEARQEGFEKGREEAYDEGYSQGHAAGFRVGYGHGREAGNRDALEEETRRIRAETTDLVATLESIIEEFGSRRRELLEASRRELVQLAMRVAEKVIHREVRLDEESVVPCVRRAVDMMFQAGRVRLELNEQDAAVIERYARQASGAFRSLPAMEIVTVAGIERGGCRVNSESGEVDVTIATQLRIIEDTLLEAARERPLSRPARPRENTYPSPGAAPTSRGVVTEPGARAEETLS
jgi:flagellar assembly protein FliH